MKSQREEARVCAQVADVQLFQEAGVRNALEALPNLVVDDRVNNILRFRKNDEVVAVRSVFDRIVLCLCLRKHASEVRVHLHPLFEVLLLAYVELDRHLAARILGRVERDVEDELVADASEEVAKRGDKAVAALEEDIQFRQEHALATGRVIVVLRVRLLYERGRVGSILDTKMAELLLKRLEKGIPGLNRKLVVLLSADEEVDEVDCETSQEAELHRVVVHVELGLVAEEFPRFIKHAAMIGFWLRLIVGILESLLVIERSLVGPMHRLLAFIFDHLVGADSQDTFDLPQEIDAQSQ